MTVKDAKAIDAMMLPLGYAALADEAQQIEECASDWTNWDRRDFEPCSEWQNF